MAARFPRLATMPYHSTHTPQRVAAAQTQRAVELHRRYSRELAVAMERGIVLVPLREDGTPVPEQTGRLRSPTQSDPAHCYTLSERGPTKIATASG